jgi:hypothetical protein
MGSRITGDARYRKTVMVPAAGVVLFIIAAVLLTSLGGFGIVASPITLPLMYAVVWLHPTRAFRIAGVVIGGITAFEGGWGFGVLLFGYDNPATLVTSFVVASTTVVVFATAGSGTPRATVENHA